MRDFSESAGAQALRVAEPGMEIREAGFARLRITLRTAHLERSRTIRDGARLDYQPKADDLHVEAIYSYSDWQRVSRR
jgi:hypothetical protein